MRRRAKTSSLSRSLSSDEYDSSSSKYPDKRIRLLGSLNLGAKSFDDIEDSLSLSLSPVKIYPATAGSPLRKRNQIGTGIGKNEFIINHTLGWFINRKSGYRYGGNIYIL